MSRVWTPRTSRAGLEYGGTAHDYYWTQAYNRYANFYNCLANCTCYCYGRVQEEGDPAPLAYDPEEPVPGASHWMWYPNEADGWSVSQFSGHQAEVQPGDIFVWDSGNHVAVVETVITSRSWTISESIYTGNDGTVSSDRTAAVMGGSSMENVSDWMIANYPTRFFNYRTLDIDNGGSWPDYVLWNPNSYRSERIFRFFGRKAKSRLRRIIYV